MSRFPPIFVSHGTPGLAVDAEAGAELAAWARTLPVPRGIVIVSAHWPEARPTRGSTAVAPTLLRDVDGYPPAEGLEHVAYHAPGAPELAYELAACLPVERSDRGWDHGVWAPLLHMFPSTPVVQLSLVTGAAPRRLYGLGRRIGGLAERGYAILGSGGITHNAAAIAPERDAPVATWAREFDGWVANLLADAEMDELFAWRTQAPHARQAHPTTEHLDPLFVVAGAASLADSAVGFPVRGFTHGTLSRRCVQFGR